MKSRSKAKRKYTKREIVYPAQIRDDAMAGLWLRVTSARGVPKYIGPFPTTDALYAYARAHGL